MSRFSRTFKRLGGRIFHGWFASDGQLPQRQRGVLARPHWIEALENRQLLSATYPEIDIRGNGQTIPNNNTTFSTADFTDMGSADVNTGSVTKTWQIANTGDGVLNITGATRVKLTGTNPGDFKVMTQPAATVAAVTGTTSFSIKFDPTAAGVRTATVTIYNDDDDEDPYSFDIEGTGTATPKASVWGNSVAIPANDTVLRLTDNTDFGSCEAAAGTISKVFTIKNTGSGDLTFTATPITITGADAGLFSISGAPGNGSTLTAGTSATFTVTFTPATNVGIANAVIHVNTADDPTFPDYHFAIKANAFNAPSIEVQGGAGPTTINPGSTNVATADAAHGTDFGSADIATGLVTHTFTINNLGSGTLKLTGTARVAVSGANPGDFVVTTQPGATVGAAGNDTFTIKFDPKAAGTRTAIVSISSNDTATGHSPYKFIIKGVGTTSPIMGVTGGGNAIANGSTSFAATDGTDMGSTGALFGTVTQTFTIRNTGSQALTLGAGAVSFTGGDAADFTVVTQPPTSIPVNGSGTFTISASPQTAAAETTTVQIANNDPNVAGGLYAFDVQATGVAVPRMSIEGNNVVIPSGNTTTSTADFTDFGSKDITGATQARAFVIKNLGLGALNMGGTAATDVVITGPAASDFTVTTPVTNDPIAASGNDTFTITFDPSATGPRIATVTITNDDPAAGNNPYTFTIMGTGTSNVAMLVKDGTDTNTITDGALTVSVATDTDFGSTDVGGSPVTHTFTIDNGGTDALNLTGSPLILIDGTFASDFTVTADPDPSVAASGTTTFDITFTPSGPGTRTATVTIFSDDSNHAEYTFNIQGVGVPQPAIFVTGLNLPLASDGSNTPDSSDNTDFGTAMNGAQTVTHTFTITNTGTAPLNLAGGAITFSIADFTTDAVLPAVIQPGATLDFNVSFLPTTTGAEAAVMHIASDDPNIASWDTALTGTGADAGLVSLIGNGQAIPNNAPAASIFNDTNFGKVEINTGKITRTFTITNIGTATLTLDATTALQLSGGNAGDFAISNGPNNGDTIAPGASVTFQVTFDPSAAGLRKTSLIITSDDGLDPSYTVPLQGTGAQLPSIQVLGHNLAIPAGDASPRPADNTDFGSTEINIAGQAITKTFVIKNPGSAGLTLSGTPKVTLSGANAKDFSVITQPAATVAAGGQTTFQIRFIPTAVDSRSATVSISSNDTTQSPYTFTITGTGLATGVLSAKGNGNVITDGDLTPATSDFTDMGAVDVNVGTITKTFTLLNTGSAPLSLLGSSPVTITGADAGDFVVSTQPASSTLAAKVGSTTFSVQFDPSAAGVRSGLINIAWGDPNAPSTYSFAIQGTGQVSPILSVTGNSATINSGDTTPSTTDGTDFGAVEMNNGLVTHTFTLNNTGAGVLRLVGARVSLAGSGDFTLVSQPSNRVAAGSGTSSFQVQFDPSGGTGVKTATVTIASDDPSHPSYTFQIQGTGSNLPVMNIQGGGNDIASGSAVISASTGTSFGSADITGVNVQHTFTIQNNGSGALNLTGAGNHITISGANAADFTVQTAPGASVAASGTTTFVIKFDPTATGVRNALISIPNSDSPRNPYTFAVQGVGTSAPAIHVYGGAGPTELSNHAAAAALTGSDFGNAEINMGTVTKTFTIKNLGSQALSLTGTPIVSITGADASDFTVTTQPASSTVAAATGTTTFQVKFDPSSAGVKNATINIQSSDVNFDFDVTGTGTVAPIVALKGNNVAINKGAATASATNQTDFGSVATNGGSLQRTYTIFNNGSATLNITSITVGGGNAADFAVGSVPASIAPNSSDTFTVTFTPSATGARSTTVTMVTNDATNSPWTFVVGGTGATAPILSVVGGAGPAAIANNSSGIGVANGTDFGSADISGGTVTHTFTIKNTGTGAMTLSGSPIVTITGANASDFTIVTQPSANVAASTGTTTIVVKFDPSAAGARTAQINFKSNDQTNGTFHFAIGGTGTTAPTMAIQGGSPLVDIPNGDTLPSAAKGDDFGNVEVNLGTSVRTITIKNTGSDALNFSGNPIVTIGGANAADFSVVYVPRRSVAPGGTTDFQLMFDPSATGVRTATISIASDDGAHNPYTFKVQGTGVAAPVIQLSGNGQTIAKGDTTPLAADSTDFGTVAASSGSVVNTFTITNLGSGTLNLNATGAKVTLSNSADFTVSTAPGSNTVAANGATTTFQITFDPATAGVKTCTVTILNDDPNGSPFTFLVSGTGV